MQWESLAALWILLALKVPNAFQQQPKSRIPTSIMLNMIILMNKVSSSFVAVVVFLELVLNFYQYLFQGGNYDGILFASGLLQTVIYRFQRNHKTELLNTCSHFFNL